MVSLKSKSLFPIFHVLLLVVLVLAWSGAAVSSGFTVRSLPGFKGPLPFHLETGYVGVGEGGDVQLFYYFIHSERNPKEDPLVLWLVGGPRCTALHGITYEIGPLHFKAADSNGSLPNLVLNPDSWTQVANVIFLDAPVDKGFSYWRTAERFLISDTISARHINQFLQNWMTDHPQFLSNPLYIGGDSYAGIVNPVIVEELINGIEAGKEPQSNFKGYFLGNPLTSPFLENDAQIPFSSRNMECLKDQEAFNECVSGIDHHHILDPSCYTFFSPEPKVSRRSTRSLASRRSTRSLASIGKYKYPSFPSYRKYGYMLSEEWANDERVRKALHIREVDQYSGDHDMIVPHISTESWIRSLNLSIADDWHPWFVNREIAGYTRTFFNGMTYATVKGGGHMTAEYKPKESFAIFKRRIDYNPL